MPPHTNPSSFVAVLANLFPAAFAVEGWQPHKPLKIGIDADLIATGCLAKWEVASALRYYCRRRMYLAALAAGGFRHDLNGGIAGEVSTADREWAQTKLAEIDRQQAEKTTSTGDARMEAQRSHTKVLPPVDHRRDGLDGLRRAAAARRQRECGQTEDITNTAMINLRKTSMGPAVEEMSQGPKARDIFDKGPMLPPGGTHGGQENTRAS
jgi:sRNA-binding protein